MFENSNSLDGFFDFLRNKNGIAVSTATLYVSLVRPVLRLVEQGYPLSCETATSFIEQISGGQRRSSARTAWRHFQTYARERGVEIPGEVPSPGPGRPPAPPAVPTRRDLLIHAFVSACASVPQALRFRFGGEGAGGTRETVVLQALGEKVQIPRALYKAMIAETFGRVFVTGRLMLCKPPPDDLDAPARKEIEAIVARVNVAIARGVAKPWSADDQ